MTDAPPPRHCSVPLGLVAMGAVGVYKWYLVATVQPTDDVLAEVRR